MSITAKFVFGDDVRRVSIPAVSADTLIAAAADVFASKLSKHFDLLYVDDEGDLCALVPETFDDWAALNAGLTCARFHIRIRNAIASSAEPRTIDDASGSPRLPAPELNPTVSTAHAKASSAEPRPIDDASGSPRLPAPELNPTVSTASERISEEFTIYSQFDASPDEAGAPMVHNTVHSNECSTLPVGLTVPIASITVPTASITVPTASESMIYSEFDGSLDEANAPVVQDSAHSNECSILTVDLAVPTASGTDETEGYCHQEDNLLDHEEEKLPLVAEENNSPPPTDDQAEDATGDQQQPLDASFSPTDGQHRSQPEDQAGDQQQDEGTHPWQRHAEHWQKHWQNYLKNLPEHAEQFRAHFQRHWQQHHSQSDDQAGGQQQDEGAHPWQRHAEHWQNHWQNYLNNWPEHMERFRAHFQQQQRHWQQHCNQQQRHSQQHWQSARDEQRNQHDGSQDQNHCFNFLSDFHAVFSNTPNLVELVPKVLEFLQGREAMVDSETAHRKDYIFPALWDVVNCLDDYFPEFSGPSSALRNVLKGDTTEDLGAALVFLLEKIASLPIEVQTTMFAVLGPCLAKFLSVLGPFSFCSPPPPSGPPGTWHNPRHPTPHYFMKGIGKAIIGKAKGKGKGKGKWKSNPDHGVSGSHDRDATADGSKSEDDSLSSDSSDVSVVPTKHRKKEWKNARKDLKQRFKSQIKALKRQHKEELLNLRNIYMEDKSHGANKGDSVSNARKESLRSLAEMGFSDRELNSTLLDKHSDNLACVIDLLVNGERL